MPGVSDALHGANNAYSINKTSPENTSNLKQSSNAAGGRTAETTRIEPGDLNLPADHPVSQKSSTPSFRNRKINKPQEEGRKINCNTGSSRRNSPKANQPISAYYSSEQSVNFNRQAKRIINGKEELIECRHLALSYALGKIGRGKDGFKAINGIDKLANCEDIINESDFRKLSFGKCPREAYYFQNGKFSQALGSIIEKYWSSTDQLEKKYLLIAEHHMMCLRLKKQDDHLKIIFYDPNDTVRDKSFIISHAGQLKSLSINNFLDPQNQGSYRMNQEPEYALFASLDTTTERDECSVYHFGSPNNHLLYLTLLIGHFGHKSLSELYATLSNGSSNLEIIHSWRSLSWEGCTGLKAACKGGHIQAATEYFDRVINDTKLSLDEKYSLLAARDESKLTWLDSSLQDNPVEALTFFTSLVKKFKLEIPRLLTPKPHWSTEYWNCISPVLSDKGSSADLLSALIGLPAAFKTGSTDAVRLYVAEILNSHILDNENKLRILQHCCKNKQPGLSEWLEKGDPDLVSAFIGLPWAVRTSYNTLRKYVADIVNCTRLSQEEKLRLFQQSYNNELPGLSEKLVKGDIDGISAYIATIYVLIPAITQNHELKPDMKNKKKE